MELLLLVIGVISAPTITLGVVLHQLGHESLGIIALIIGVIRFFFRIYNMVVD